MPNFMTFMLGMTMYVNREMTSKQLGNKHIPVYTIDNAICNVHKKQKIFSGKQKEFRDGLLYSTPQKSEETREMPLPSLGRIPLKKM